MKYDECPCAGITLDRFLRPTVLAVLAAAPKGRHGYLIAQSLRSVASFGDDPPDSAGLYRVLKAMETEGHLRSTWDTRGSGPAKRVYVLTNAGRGCLRRWVRTLESYSHNLQKTVRFLKNSLAPSRQEARAR
jgi:DNA-binding PadR family transcriptional regulator